MNEISPLCATSLTTDENFYVRMMAVAAAFLFWSDFVKLHFKRTKPRQTPSAGVH